MLPAFSVEGTSKSDKYGGEIGSAKTSWKMVEEMGPESTVWEAVCKLQPYEQKYVCKNQEQVQCS